MTNEELEIKRDRLRFTKNSTSSNLCYLAIVFDVLYFASIYSSDMGNVGNYYYTYMIGISVVYNLVFLLAAFLASEGVKNYKLNYSYLLIILGVIQIVRILIFPMDAHSSVIDAAVSTNTVMSTSLFIRSLIYLIGSAVCLVASAVVNFSKCKTLEAHLRTLESKTA